LDFPVDLRQRFFSAHRQHRMPQAHENRNHRGHVREFHAVEPAHSVGTQLNVLGSWDRWQCRVADKDGVHAPTDQDHDHHRRDLHNAHSFLAGFVYALDVVPPEIEGTHDGEARRAYAWGDVQADVEVIGGFVDEADDVLPRGNAADRAGKDVIEHQGGDAELCQRAAHGFLDHAVHAAAHEHAAALDVDGAHAVGKQHDAEDARSFRTMAAARQKEMKLSSAVVATRTRGIPLPRRLGAAGLWGELLIR